MGISGDLDAEAYVEEKIDGAIGSRYVVPSVAKNDVGKVRAGNCS
jgi:hypothetical protein